jgi:serine/threonine-protein kinase RsbW
MSNRIEAVDPMVLTLKSQVEGVLPDEAMWRFDICLSETLANLVLHADTDLKEEPIDVVLAVSDGVITAEIFDPKGALPFDVRQSARCLSDIDGMSEHGRGLGLIIECADGVDYGPSLDRNRLALTFMARL